MKHISIYFRGFNHNNEPTSSKYELLKKWYDTDFVNWIMVDQNLDDPQKTIDEVESLISDYDKIFIVASSLGCLSALYFSFVKNSEIVLINPGFFPEDSIKDELSELELRNIAELRDRILKLRTGKKINLLISEDDELVDPKPFIDIFRDNIRFIDSSPVGGHSYSILGDKMRMISNLLHAELFDEDDDDISEANIGL
ncbi:hypothetical protein KAH27_10555 [bacterium]|nr:hypothetical protein [bacterium]